LQTKTDQGITYSNKNMGFTQSQHFVIGYENNLTENTRVKLESYYQLLNNIPVNSFSSAFSAINDGTSFVPSQALNLVNNGTGTNYGLELTLERFFNKGFYYLITGSLFDSKYKGSDGIERNTGFNTKYAANLLVGKEFKLGKKGNVLAFNFKATSVGGKYLTPLDLEKSKLAGMAVYDESKAFSERQPDYFRMDAKIAYRKELKKSTLEFAIDFQNVTNHKNVFLQGYNARNNTISTEYQQGFFPVPMFKFTF
jgi:outer membrane receptor protein involved in Fe transport